METAGDKNKIQKKIITVEFLQLPSVEVKDNKNSDAGLAVMAVNRLVTYKRRAADQPRLKSIQELKRCKVVDISNNDKLRTDIPSIAENTDKIPVRKKVPRNAIDESQNLPIGKASKKSCSLCKRTGHHNQYECYEFKRVYGVTPVAKSDSTARDNIVKSLLQVNKHPIYNRNDDDERIVMKELPKRMAALVIHRKYKVDDNNMSQTYQDNICIECSVVKEGLIPHDLNTRQLCEPTAVSRYIMKSKSNIVGSQL